MKTDEILYEVKYENDTGQMDEGFAEWYEVYANEEYICMCSEEKVANLIVEALKLRLKTRKELSEILS